MDTTNTVRRAAKAAGRPAALALTVLVFLLAAGFGASAFDTGEAGAQAVLTGEAFCQPDPVRPNVPVLMSCTTRLTNEGDATATNLVANIAPASGCTVPSRYAFLDRTVDGELVAVSPTGLSFPVPDLVPGETSESVIRLVVLNTSSGPTGGNVTVTSQDDRSVMASQDVCWTVSRDAEAPAGNLRVTKRLLTEQTPIEPPRPEPPPPPPPEDGAPVPIPPLPSPVFPEQAEFEIVVTNVSAQEMTNVTLLDVPTGDATLVSADPPATGADLLGRPTWDLGSLAPGAEARVVATLGAAPDANCAYADDIAIATGTPPGGTPEDYPAFSDMGIPVGPCVFEEPDYCWHYPPEGEPVISPCAEEVCWAQSPDGFGYQPVFACDPTVQYCWFTPPGEGYNSLRPCADEVCWISFSEGDFEYYSEVPCDYQFCRFTAPDGSYTTTGDCAYPVCWSTPPGGGAWQPVWGCEQYGEQCWFTPPGDGEPFLTNCDQELCWLSSDGGGPLYFVPCDVEFCQYTAPDGSTSTTSDCAFPVCWTAPPEGGPWQPAWGCEQYEELCWFTPPDGSPSQLGSCQYPLRFAVNPPEGGIVLWPQPIYFEGDACWPVPPDGGEFYTFPISCSEVEYIWWFTPPEGGPAVPTWGMDEACWEPLPPDVFLPPGVELPPDFQIPSPCPPGEEGKTGVPGSSVPAEVVDAASTPAEVIEGTVTTIDPLPSADVSPAEMNEGLVERIEPQPSASITPAELIRTERVEPAPPPVVPPGDVIELPTSPGDRGEDQAQPGQPGPTLPDLLGFPGPSQPQAPGISALPGSGTGPAGSDLAIWPWALVGGLAAAGLLLGWTAARLRRRWGL